MYNFNEKIEQPHFGVYKPGTPGLQGTECQNNKMRDRPEPIDNNLFCMAQELHRIVYFMVIRYGITGRHLEYSTTERLEADEQFLSRYVDGRDHFRTLGTDINRHSQLLLENIRKELKSRRGRARYEAALKSGLEGELQLHHKVSYLPQKDFKIFGNPGQHMYVHFNALHNELDCMVLSRKQKRLFLIESKKWAGTLYHHSDDTWESLVSGKRIKRKSPFLQLQDHERLLGNLLDGYGITISPVLVITDPLGRFVNENPDSLEYPVLRLVELLKHLESYGGDVMANDEFDIVVKLISESIDFVCR